MDPDSHESLESLRQTCYSLRNLVQALVIVLIVLSASLNLFILRQVMIIRNDVQRYKQSLATYDEEAYPMLEDFLKKLSSFSEEYPDFEPILRRHFPDANPVADPSSPGE